MNGDMAARISAVLEKVNAAISRRPSTLPAICPRVVAVSKTKPVGDIVSAYSAGQRHFGENYLQELEEKSKNSQILEQCVDIRWHYIGNLQSNKVSKIAALPSLYMVETISSSKLATSLNAACERSSRPESLKVMVQVNSSGEQTKGGCSIDNTTSIATTIRDQCPNLTFAGLMTIGSFDHDLSTGPNPDFQVMLKCRETLCSDLSLDPSTVELSMGMSADYEHAIEVGSTNVRIGSTIFGSRVYPAKT